MAWLKLDDKMYSHPKVHSLKNDAFRVHIGGLLHSSLQLTDGEISPAALHGLTVLGMRKVERLAAELVAAGLWRETEAGSWVINDYLEYNPSKADVLAKRKAEAERKAEQRSKKVPSVVPLGHMAGLPVESETA